MVILIRVKGASLVETLTASVIIVVVFMIASFSFNNIFLNSIRADDQLLQNRVEELQYLSGNGRISYPYYEEGPYWEISGEQNDKLQVFKILNRRNGKEKEVQMLKQ